MTSIQTVGRIAIRTTLLNEPDIVNLVDDRIYWEHAIESTAYPFITMSHISGGDDNDAQSRALDFNWKVVGHSANLARVGALADAISKALVRVVPDTSNQADVAAYTWIEELIPVFDPDIEQNTTFYQAGGIYRVRLSLGANFV